MTDNYKRKPQTNSLLTILTALDLLVVIISVAALPITMFTLDRIAFNPKFPMGVSNTYLIGSVPIVTVVMVILAWLVQGSGNVKAARLFAAVPLVWGFAVFLMMLPTTI